MSVVAPDGSLYVAHSPLRRAAGKAMYSDLTPAIIGGIARFKPIRLNLLARDTICAAEARSANASTLDGTTEQAAINTDVRQIKILLKQAGSAILRAVNDGDMTTEDATALGNLLEQSTDGLTLDGLTPSVAFLTTAYAMFN